MLHLLYASNITVFSKILNRKFLCKILNVKVLNSKTQNCHQGNIKTNTLVIKFISSLITINCKICTNNKIYVPASLKRLNLFEVKQRTNIASSLSNKVYQKLDCIIIIICDRTNKSIISAKAITFESG